VVARAKNATALAAPAELQAAHVSFLSRTVETHVSTVETPVSTVETPDYEGTDGMGPNLSGCRPNAMFFAATLQRPFCDLTNNPKGHCPCGRLGEYHVAAAFTMATTDAHARLALILLASVVVKTSISENRRIDENRIDSGVHGEPRG
jgi:hypothetical protein